MLAATFNNFLQVFGDLSFGTVLLVCAALFFVWGVMKNTQKSVIDHYEKQKGTAEQLQQAIDAVAKLPEYRQQSIEKQKEIQGALADLKLSIAHLESRIDALEDEKNERELNRLRENLIYNYRFYASKEKNPLMAWSEMEKDSFYKIFKDYEKLGGDGFMHSIVQPAMDALRIVPMHEIVALDELMKSRN